MCASVPIHFKDISKLIENKMNVKVIQYIHDIHSVLKYYVM
jgi:hypothetical protein